jgi:hypothetical protein
MQLHTDIATKDLGLLKLNQKIIHLETSLEESQTKPVTSCAGVGDGELIPDMLPVREEDFLAEKSKLEQEVNDALARIVFLEQQMTDTKQQLHVAERAVANEKACNASIMPILEEKSENSSSHLLNKLSEEQEQSERAVNVIKEELAREQASSWNKIDSICAGKESVEQQIAYLEDQLTSAQASHKSSLVELKVKHNNDLTNALTSKPKILPQCAKLSPILDQKVVWLGTDGDPGAALTLHHHSLDPYGGHGMIQQHHILWHASKQHQFCLSFGRNTSVKPKTLLLYVNSLKRYEILIDLKVWDLGLHAE